MADQIPTPTPFQRAELCVAHLRSIKTTPYAQEHFLAVLNALNLCIDTNVAEHVLEWARSGRREEANRPITLNLDGGGVHSGNYDASSDRDFEVWEYPNVSADLIKALAPFGSTGIHEQILRWFLGDWLHLTWVRAAAFSEADSLPALMVTQGPPQNLDDDSARPEYNSTYSELGGTCSVLPDGATSELNAGSHPPSISACPWTAEIPCIPQSYVDPAEAYVRIQAKLISIIELYGRTPVSVFFVQLRDFLNTPGLSTTQWLELTQTDDWKEQREGVWQGIGFRWLVGIFQTHQDRDDMEKVTFRVLCLVAVGFHKRWQHVYLYLGEEERLDLLVKALDKYVQGLGYQDTNSLSVSSALSLLATDYQQSSHEFTFAGSDTAGSARQTQSAWESASFETRQ